MANTPIVSDSRNAEYDGNLSTASGFYAAEAWNLGAYSTTTLAISTPRTIDVTFAHAGNCQGVVLGCYAISSVTTAYGMKVSLQENVASVWTIRATKELTAAEINPEYILGSAMGISGANFFFSFVPFKFDTPYAVDATASKWRFYIENGTSAGSSSVWQLSTSNATAPSYVTWCDNQATATDGDILIVADKVTIDKSFTTGAALGTGEATVGVAGWICRSTDISKTGVCLLEWENPPVASYTFTFGGRIMLGKFAGLRVGAEANPIPNAQQAILTCTASAVAGTARPGFSQCIGTTSSRGRGKPSIFLYGEIPTKPYGILASDAAISQANITLTEDLSANWAANDYVYVGKQDVIGQGTVVWQQISSISGTTVTLTSNLLTNARKAGGYVFNRDKGWGIKLLGKTNANYLLFTLEHPQFCEIEGCLIQDATITLYATTSCYNYPLLPSNRAKYVVQDNMWVATSTTMYSGISAVLIPPEGMVFQRNYAFRMTSLYNPVALYLKTIAALPFYSGLLECYDNISLARYSYPLNYSAVSNVKNYFERNIFQNAISSTAAAVVHGLAPRFKDNYFWGCASTLAANGAVSYMNSVAADISGNHYDKCTCALTIFATATILQAAAENEVFGEETANTSDFGTLTTGYHDITFIDPSATLTFDATHSLADAVTLSKISIVNEGEVANVDSVYTPLGTFRRCGDGLDDTTVHTTGTNKFSLRYNSAGGDNLAWSFNVPTGDIQNKTAAIACWVKINSENFWGSANSMPRMTVNYDNGSTDYAEAAETTDWQLLFVPFTPLTAYGQITVTIGGYSDVGDSDGYFYVDDITMFYPAGVTLNLGGMDLWANAMPITPPIATGVNANDVWAVQTSTLTTPGTAGKKLKDGLTLGQFIGIK
jgi:hypothetical protein